MEAYSLSGGAGQDPLRSGVARLIELVGTSRFEDEAFQVAREATRCEHLTAFGVRGNASPRLLFAANSGPSPVAKRVAHKYLQHYWELDPARRLDLIRGKKSRGDVAVRIVSNDISDGAYRDECYTAVKLIDRFTVVQRRNHETVCLNFYRGARSGPFNGSELDRIASTADLWISLVLKHEQNQPDGDSDIANSFVQRLCLYDPSLPPREAEICGAIATGKTSEAIALTLGISINTVLTYRKRAYLRLGISSQNELLRLVLS